MTVRALDNGPLARWLLSSKVAPQATEEIHLQHPLSLFALARLRKTSGLMIFRRMLVTVAKSPFHQLPAHFLQKVSNFEQTAGETTTETVCHHSQREYVKHGASASKVLSNPALVPFLV
jgi:hypothetical protein